MSCVAETPRSSLSADLKGASKLTLAVIDANDGTGGDMRELGLVRC